MLTLHEFKTCIRQRRYETRHSSAVSRMTMHVGRIKARSLAGRLTSTKCHNSRGNISSANITSVQVEKTLSTFFQKLAFAIGGHLSQTKASASRSRDRTQLRFLLRRNIPKHIVEHSEREERCNHFFCAVPLKAVVEYDARENPSR